MSLNLSFKEGDWVDFKTWRDGFAVSGQSGINVSTANRLVVCVSKAHGDGVPYQDRWYSHDEWDGVRYTGQGLLGDQKIESGVNKTLAEAQDNGSAIHVLRKFPGESRYLYCGKFKLVGKPTTDQQGDANGKQRTVWMFNLKAASGRFAPEVMAALDDVLVTRT